MMIVSYTGDFIWCGPSPLRRVYGLVSRLCDAEWQKAWTEATGDATESNEI